jgi:hypothetical protein
MVNFTNKMRMDITTAQIWKFKTPQFIASFIVKYLRLTTANLSSRVSAGCAGLLLLVEGDLSAAAASRVGLSVSLTERLGTLRLRYVKRK